MRERYVRLRPTSCGRASGAELPRKPRRAQTARPLVEPGEQDEQPLALGPQALDAREEERGVDDLARLREAPCRPVDPPPLERRRVVAVDREQERRLDRTGAESVHADAVARELHRELAGQREDGSLGGGVRDLR